MTQRYTMYCDESIEKGKYYSDFYGGVMVATNKVDVLTKRIRNLCDELHMVSEFKWTKVTPQYLDKYIQIMDLFFEIIRAGDAKVRIMFRQSANIAQGVNQSQKQKRYFLLYYQFIKHAFGLPHIYPDTDDKVVRIFFDELPDSRKRATEFKSHIAALSYLNAFSQSNVSIGTIGEVDSKKHELLQSLDVVLGAMAFRLNNLHKVIPEGAHRRGKRTVAKEKLYKHILAHIRQIRPNFNIGVSTRVSMPERFDAPYTHWNFIPKNFEVDTSRYK